MKHRYQFIMQEVLQPYLKIIRSKYGLSQEEMSECLGISYRSYVNLEHRISVCSGTSLGLFLIQLQDDEVLEILNGVRTFAEKEGILLMREKISIKQQKR